MPRATITIKAVRRPGSSVDYPTVVTAVIQTNGDVLLTDDADFRKATNLVYFIKHYEAVS